MSDQEPDGNLQRYVIDFGEDVFTINGTELICEICAKKITTYRRFNVLQHTRTLKHVQRLANFRATSAAGDSPLPANALHVPLVGRDFNLRLCKMMIETNIPLFKLQHPSFRNFFTEEYGQDLPNHTTLRKTSLRQLYEETILKIRVAIGDNRIWISIDETTDAKGQFVVNTVVGVLSAGAPSTPFLLGSEVVEKTSHASVAQALIASLNLLWPEGYQHDRIFSWLRTRQHI